LTMSRKLLAVGALAFVFSAFLVGRVLAEFDWNPSATIKFGEVFTEQNAYAEELLGEIVLAPEAGHDGKFFFSQAMDPFYMEPDIHAVFLDRPTYRAQRMLYPTVASLGGLLSPVATAWGLIVVNVLALVAGTAFTGLVAQRLGLSTWFGLAFLLNPGLLVALNIDGANIVAMAGLMAGVYYVMEDRLLAASLAMTASVLARETMLIAVLGLALFWYFRKRRYPWSMLIPPGAAVAWWVFVHWRLDDGLAQDTKAVGLPMVGFVHAFRHWAQSSGATVDLLMGSVLLVVSLAILIRAFRTPTALGWGVAGFAVLAPLISEPVWLRYFDSTRALAPVLTAYALLIPAAIKARRKGNGSAGTSPGDGDSKRSTNSLVG